MSDNPFGVIPWSPFEDLNFENEEEKIYSIDTRDFHFLPKREYWASMRIEGLHKAEKYPEQYVYTAQEMLDLVTRYYNESGGKGTWRMFQLQGDTGDSTGWDLKYLRIVRLKNNKGLIMCRGRSEQLKIIPKSILSLPVHKRYLNHMDDNGD
jgi:hypothetical protein